jgi:hypothetical protein
MDDRPTSVKSRLKEIHVARCLQTSNHTNTVRFLPKSIAKKIDGSTQPPLTLAGP